MFEAEPGGGAGGVPAAAGALEGGSALAIGGDVVTGAAEGTSLAGEAADGGAAEPDGPADDGAAWGAADVPQAVHTRTNASARRFMRRTYHRAA